MNCMAPDSLMIQKKILCRQLLLTKEVPHFDPFVQHFQTAIQIVSQHTHHQHTYKMIVFGIMNTTRSPPVAADQGV